MTPEEALLLWLRRASLRGQLAVRLERHIRPGLISLSEAAAILDRVLEESNMIEAPPNDQPLGRPVEGLGAPPTSCERQGCAE